MFFCDSCGGTVSFIVDEVARCEYCGTLYWYKDGKLGNINLEELYVRAVRMSESHNKNSLQKAIKIFELMDGYRDSVQFIQSCKESIERLAVEQEMKVTLSDDVTHIQKRAVSSKPVSQSAPRRQPKSRNKILPVVIIVTIIVMLALFEALAASGRDEEFTRFWYGDDYVLDDNIKFSKKTYDIQVDTSDVEDLKIEMYGDGNMGSEGISVLLGNLMLVK